MDPFSIAVIGGGYAGLTLANHLQSSPDKRIACRVFEAKDEPVPIVGTIHLPLARQLLQELGFLSLQQQDVFRGPDLVDRQAFLRLFRTKISMEYSRRIVRVEECCRPGSKEEQYWLWDDQRGRHGPFHCIVDATGLSFASNQHRLPATSAVIGDARWQYDTWFWDFGRRRIQRGGDIALHDARELALTLRQSSIEQSSSNGGNDGRGWKFEVPTKFQPKPITSWRYRWHTSRVIFFGIILAIISRILVGLEKI